jgi:outer membrane protein TolC
MMSAIHRCRAALMARVPATPAARRRVHTAGAVIALALLAASPLSQAAEALSYEEAQYLAMQSPALSARQAALASANSARRAAGQLPDPKLSYSIENVPVTGADRYTVTRDLMTMRRIGIDQDMPTGAKREAQRERASALEWRERNALARERLRVQHEVAMAWLARYYAERRLAVLEALERENALLLQTLPARIAAGTATADQSPMARQEQAALADRRDELERDRRNALAMLRRWIGEAGTLALEGGPPDDPIDASQLRAQIEQAADVTRFDAELAMADAELHEAIADQRGDWRWGVSYAQRGPAYDNMISVQVGIDLPLRKGERQIPIARAREQDRARVLAEREDALREQRAALDAQLASLDDLERRITRLERTARPLAEERVRLATAAYASPRGTLADVLAARRERAELEWRALDLEMQRQQVRVSLHHFLLPTRP